MSLCMAATCSYKDEPCIVYCVDTAGTRGDSKSEDISKIRDIGGNFVVLAGNMSDARQLLAVCRPFIAKYQTGGDDLAITRLKQDLSEAVRIRKREISTSVLSAELGVTYDEVFNWSQAHPDDPTWRGAWSRIKSLSLEAELIIGTYTDDEAAILCIESNGKVTWADHYAAIGTGSNIANAFMSQRPYFDSMSLEDCLFKILEAKTAAEKNPYVGKTTMITLRTPREIFGLGHENTEYMAEQVRDMRKITPTLAFKEDEMVHLTSSQKRIVYNNNE